MSVQSTPAAEQPFWMTGTFAPVSEEIDATGMKVTGEIPAELNGRYFRNGANPRVTASPDWFLGEGMIHGVRIENGKAVWYKNRYVQTPLLDIDVITREHTSIPGNSLANTHIVSHGGKVLALQEMHPPIEMTDELDTVGVYRFDDKLAGNMTAHPKICPKTGEMHFFGYGVRPPFLTYHCVSSDGELTKSEVIEIGAAVMMHDFLITENYVVFLDLPMLWDMENFLRSGVPVAFDDEYGARIGLMPRSGGNSDIKWYEIDPCYVYHTLNAYETGNEVVVIAPRLHGYTSVGMKNPPIPKLHRWVINLENGSVRESQLDDVGVDFPRVANSLVGQQNRFGFLAEFETSGRPHILGYHKYDLQSGSKTSHHFTDGRVGAEAVFIEAQGATSEDQGYLMTFVFDPGSQTSELVIIDAQNLDQPPLARIHLPARVPAGFHGSWIPDA